MTLTEEYEAAEPPRWPPSEAWESRGACVGAPLATFFPEPDVARMPGAWDAARQICRGCPVLSECADFAVRALPHRAAGMWGGMTPNQRRKARSRTQR
ncbi:MAG: WhiB family transcriptional regulator [Bryobacteraceae bacterium]